METLTQALISAFLLVLTTGLPLGLLLFRTWANAKIVSMEAATLDAKASRLAEAAKRGAGQVLVQMQASQVDASRAMSEIRETASSVVSNVLTKNFADTVQELGGTSDTVAGMIQGELGKLLANHGPVLTTERAGNVVSEGA
jgi:hypothetical protein